VQYEQVNKVELATTICRERALNADIVGNIQLDAALDNKVLNLKYPETSFVAPANVIIFPTLDAGNIGYKLVQRFTGAEAIGPILQGLAKPVNDLSRGCSVEEIINTSIHKIIHLVKIELIIFNNDVIVNRKMSGQPFLYFCHANTLKEV
jgi:phosphate acetyltransferase